MSNSNWMSRIVNDPQLVDMVIPGSHDAGVYGDSLSTHKSPESWARCQGSKIFEQAMHGSRMFDCRVFLKMNAETKQLEPTMGHFFKEKKKHNDGSTGKYGAYGGTLLTAIKDAVLFVEAAPTEFIILRFSHTYCPDQVGDALKQLMKEDSGFNKRFGDYIYKGQANIALERLSQLRGKVVMVFASEFHTKFSADDGYLPFYKYNTGMKITSGLATCGIYKSTGDMAKVTSTAEQAADEHKAHPKDHLHFVYWQQTVYAGDIKKHTTDEKTGAHAKLGGFINEIKNEMRDGDWDLPNVISHDFVNEETCRQIIELNPSYQRP